MQHSDIHYQFLGLVLLHSTLKFPCVTRGSARVRLNIAGEGLPFNGLIGVELYRQSYTCRRQKLTLLYLFTNLFRKEIFSHSSEYLQGETILYKSYAKTKTRNMAMPRNQSLMLIDQRKLKLS